MKFIKETYMRFAMLVLACTVCGWMTTTTAFAGTPLPVFHMEDQLRRHWNNELVFFTVDDPSWGRKDLVLRNPDGKVIPHQWVAAQDSPRGKKSVAFLADVPELGKADYVFETGNPPRFEGTLGASETADILEITNNQIGLRLHRGNRALTAGPVAGVRLGSGAWVGGGEFVSTQKADACLVSVAIQGPVFIDATVNYRWGKSGSWWLKFRIIRDEPVVLVDEKFDLPGDASWRFTATQNGPADKIFHREGKGTGHQESWTITTTTDAREPGYVLEPWLHWNRRTRQGNWLALYNDVAPDMLVIGAINPAAWVDPKRNAGQLPQSPASVEFNLDAGSLKGVFPLGWGARRWLMANVDKTESLKELSKPALSADRYRSPLSQQCVIKHGDFPLDMVKEYTLQWSGDFEDFPRLLVSKARLSDWRKSVDAAALREQIPSLLGQRIGMYTTERWILPYLATGDEKLGAYLTESAARFVQDSVDMYTKQDNHPTIGFAPHHQQMVSISLLLADAVMAGGHMPADVKRRILAQAAFLGYTLDRDDYCSPSRGFAGLPNMTTSAYGYKATVACFIPSHPLAKNWVVDALREIKLQINEMSDENGGWLEAPHYAMVSFDQILGVLVMAHNAGFDDDVFNPRLRKVIEWLGKISTPPDSRFGGFRHLPPIGNTEMIEPCGEFGVIAYLWRDRDPQFSRQMQWMYHQQRSWPQPGIGGGYPALSGFRSLMLDPNVNEEPPAWGSEIFPQTGVVLRNGYPSERETMLYLIAGEHRSHYDADSGSLTFWGKGRILCDDFGYYGRAPGEDHSMVTAAAANESNIMNIETFAPSAQADYLRGRKNGWRRQVMLVKDADPLGANYAVVCDTLAVAGGSAKWRLWTTSQKVDCSLSTAHVEGKEDVDMDVFFAWPPKPEVAVESKSRTASAGTLPNGNYGKFPTTQNGLILPMSESRVLAVLYPKLKTQAAATMTSFCDGRVAHVQSESGDDWIFLASDPFEFKQDGIEFIGTAGLVHTRKKTTTLIVPEPGRLAANGRIVDKGKPVKSASNLIDFGDFENGQNQFLQPTSGPLKSCVFEGNPAKSGTTHAGKYCLAIQHDPAAKTPYGSISHTRYIPVNPKKTYRFGLSLYSDKSVSVSIGGYAQDTVGKQLRDAKGVWQYSMPFKGPVDHWTRVEKTIGPIGTNADFHWLAETEYTGMTFWITGEDYTLYIDDVVVEEVTDPHNKDANTR